VSATAPLHGLIAEFASDEALVAAARAAREAGYRRIEAYSPFAIDGLADALELRPNRVPLATLIGGVAGGIGIYLLQWYTAVFDYPIDAGGRPLHSWPAFVPATFEMCVLGAAIAGFVAMLAGSGLPRLRHPVFEAPDFDLASRNRFFLCIEAADARFERDATSAFLAGLSPVRVAEVPGEGE
jgi:hypothetical protein